MSDAVHGMKFDEFVVDHIFDDGTQEAVDETNG